MKARLEEVFSRILSEKYDAKIKITFKERYDEPRRRNRRVSDTGTNARR